MSGIDPNTVEKAEVIDLLKAKEQLETAIAEFETDILGIKNEILQRLKKANLKSDKVDKWLLTRYTDTRFKTTLVQARELGATKKEEKVDTAQLKKIHEAGGKVPGVYETERLRVGEVSQDENIS